MKHDYTGKFAIGQAVRFVASGWKTNGVTGVVTEINLSSRGYPYRVNFGHHHVYHPECELEVLAPVLAPTLAPSALASYTSMDTDSGLGISGINNDQSMPMVPSVRAIERLQRMTDADTICRRCGASQNFDGAMFTTLGGSSICDDCA